MLKGPTRILHNTEQGFRYLLSSIQASIDMQPVVAKELAIHSPGDLKDLSMIGLEAGRVYMCAIKIAGHGDTDGVTVGSNYFE